MVSMGQGYALRSVGLSGLDFVQSDEIVAQDYCSQSFHVGAITGIDSCVRKPLFVTSSSDRTIHIWNYNERTTEQVKAFAEEVYSVSFHPMGMHLLAGFSDKLRLMAILIDDIRPIKEYAVRACSECRFSNGGHLFAAVNGNTVQIYNTYSCENVGNLRGHNSKVQSIFWSSDDSRIVTASTDGAVYEWKLKDLKRDRESVQKSCSYYCVAASLDMRSIFAVGSDRKLKEIDDGSISKEFGADVLLTQVGEEEGREENQRVKCVHRPPLTKLQREDNTGVCAVKYFVGCYLNIKRNETKRNEMQWFGLGVLQQARWRYQQESRLSNSHQCSKAIYS